MDYLSLIKAPIADELAEFVSMFNESLTHSDGLLGTALSHIRQRGGKRMRPMLILLMAKNFGRVSHVTQNAAVGLELLLRVSLTDLQKIVQLLAELGRTLAAGEILQLSNIQNQAFSEDVYYQIINNKTAALFEACAKIGAISAGASDEEIAEAAKFGQNIGIIFQIRDDIFDYFDSKEIGKPTGNDMLEGKLTLPVIYALNNSNYESMQTLARKVKAGTVNADEIAVLVEFTKEQGGIEYAERRMEEIASETRVFIDKYVKEKAIRDALTAYLDYVIQRNY